MKLKVLKFKADWCVPCRSLSPIIKSISEEKGFSLVEIDVEENDEVTEEYKVRSLPTLVFLQDNVEKERCTGSKTKQQLLEIINKYD